MLKCVGGIFIKIWYRGLINRWYRGPMMEANR